MRRKMGFTRVEERLECFNGIGRILELGSIKKERNVNNVSILKHRKTYLSKAYTSTQNCGSAIVLL